MADADVESLLACHDVYYGRKPSSNKGVESKHRIYQDDRSPRESDTHRVGPSITYIAFAVVTITTDAPN